MLARFIILIIFAANPSWTSLHVDALRLAKGKVQSPPLPLPKKQHPNERQVEKPSQLQNQNNVRNQNPK
jgi:hypothetical protein